MRRSALLAYRWGDGLAGILVVEEKWENTKNTKRREATKDTNRLGETTVSRCL